VSRDVLFFDLDGTLIDSAVGITRCVAYALERMQQPVPPPAELRRWIGPALRTSFTPLFGDAQRVEQAVALYRERFELHGWQEHDVYAGIGEVVQGLHAAGHRLAEGVAHRAALALERVLDLRAVPRPPGRLHRRPDPVRVGHRLFDGDRRGCGMGTAGGGQQQQGQGQESGHRGHR